MANLFNYLKKYGDVSFTEKGLTDIDVLIFSQLTYLDFDGLVPPKGSVPLIGAIEQFLINHDKKDYFKRGFAYNEVWKMCEILIKIKRYQEMKIMNYVYHVSNNEQFSALCLRDENKNLFVCYEGTDENIVGWEEDAALCYKFPVPSQIDAIRYLRKAVRLTDSRVFLLGHSKGGHLALVAGMYAPFYIQNKIKKIYNFDGPGFRKRQIYSNRYKKIENKICFYIPNYSIIGLLLRHGDNYKAIASTRIDLYAHSVFTWLIKDDEFYFTELSYVSKRLDKSITEWLDLHDDVEREKLSKAIFKVIYDAGLDNFIEIVKLKNILAILIQSKEMDESTKKMLKNFVVFNVESILDKEKGSLS